MKWQVFAIYDSKARGYNQPFYFQSVEMARRAFFDVVNDKTTMFYKHGTDYTLFHLGEFDDETARFSELEAHFSLGLASQFRQPEKE